jgi:hypothetical protein
MPARPDKQGRCSFLKKRTKKLLRLWLGVATASEPNKQKSFASFLQKRRPYFSRMQRTRSASISN